MSDEKSQLDEIPPHSSFGMTDYILMHRNALEFSKILIELRSIHHFEIQLVLILKVFKTSI